MLQRTSVSVNIKERLDFSCALVDAQGQLVANAPHIPVHLGSLGVCVRAVMRKMKLSPGDTIITNHPAYGGSHLPDITLITPVFSETEKLIGCVVNRAHHAEIGGRTPASMPPDARSLAEEGVVIYPDYLIRNHEPRWDRIRQILLSGKYPSRAVEENLADLKAALAANINGREALLEMVQFHGLEQVLRYMNRLRKHAAQKMRDTLHNIPDGVYESEERLDDGSPLKARICIKDGHCDIDFSGTGPVHNGNMNATLAIVHGVVIYVMRLLINEPLPLNDGIMEPLHLRIPDGLLNPDFSGLPEECPAIVGGNVEVSQRLTDTLLKPFNIMACSQGTMNNVLFGSDHFSYYETVCGGCGASKEGPGASGVHHHMTNTRITDPEILEFRYPVRLELFQIRRGSGGAGFYHGGNGVIRAIRFLEDASLSVLSQHRIEQPYGILKGEPGMPGRQYIVRLDGSHRALKSVDGANILKGELFYIHTPGGGGWGHPDKKGNDF